MESEDRGTALIINTVSGNDNDNQKLDDLFQWLGFTVKQESDLAFIKAGQEPKNSESSDCFVCVLLKAPSAQQYTSDILDYFKNCKDDLVGKPKMLFIVNWKPRNDADSDSVSKDSTEPEIIPEMADVLVVSSHEPKYTEDESIFVRELDSALRSQINMNGCNFLNLITRVFGETTENVKHMDHVPYFTSTLRNDLFLQHKERIGNRNEEKNNSDSTSAPLTTHRQQTSSTEETTSSSVQQQAFSDTVSQPSIAAKIDKPVCINISNLEDVNYIIGMTVLSDGRLVLADWYINCIYILDHNYKLVSRVPLSSPPRCIAKVGNDKLAVTFFNECKIQFMSVSGHLGRHIKTTDLCCGIVHIPNKLIVAVHEKVQVLDMNGVLIKQLYSGPSTYLAISPDNTILYVSGGWRYMVSVTSMTLEGEVLATYSDYDLDYEFDFTTGSLTVDRAGRVHVCANNTIHQLTRDCTKIQVLCLKGLRGPETVAYSDRENKIFVSCGWRDTEIQVFQLQ